MDLLDSAKQKLTIALETINNAQDYTQSIKQILQALDDGLQFSKQHYSALNALTMTKDKNLSGADIYFFFMRFTHQFFNVMNIIQTIPNASYFEKFQHVVKVRQQRFEEVRADAISQANKILG
jgi:hypothetical protein